VTPSWKIRSLLPGLLALGCAPRALTPGVADPRPFGPAWSAPLHREHPLAGRILDVKARRWVDEARLDAALRGADIVILGEVHDNPDHHLLQAREIRAVAAAGRRPVLAMEMLDTPVQAELDALWARGSPGADEVAAAVGWAKGGWPDFALYRPIVEAGLAAGLPIVAANLPREAARKMMKEGPESLPADVRAWLLRAPPLTSDALAFLRRKMAEEHCGAMPEALVRPLVDAQRARDAQLALRAAASGGGAILVVGHGHADRERGVPAWLAREAPARSVLVVAHLEVEEDRPHPDDYAEALGGSIPFDLVVFTPAAEREDPCRKLRRQMEQRGGTQGARAR
jgi:uncharacterized iron-regulated protein